MGTNEGYGGGYWTAGDGGGSGNTADIRAPAVIVGNALEGDTADVCDILDPGDGTGFEAALLLAGANGRDVWVRPGTYDFAAGAATLPMAIPSGVTVRGAGRDLVFFSGQAAQRRIFDVEADAELWDCTLVVIAPAGEIVGDSVLFMSGDRAAVRRLFCDLTNVPDDDTDTLTSFLYIDDQNVLLSGVICEDITAVNAPALGGTFPESSIFAVYWDTHPGTPADQVPNRFIRCTATGADYGFFIATRDDILDCVSLDAEQFSVRLLGATRTRVLGGIYRPALDATSVIDMGSGTTFCLVQGIGVLPAPAPSSATVFRCLSGAEDNTFVGNSAGANYATGLSFTGDRNIAVANHMPGLPITISSVSDGSYVDYAYQRIRTITAGTYTVGDRDQGATLRFTAVGGCAVTIPSDLTIGFWCICVQATGAGQVTFTAGAGAALEFNSVNFQAQTEDVGSRVRVSAEGPDGSSPPNTVIGLTWDLDPV